MEIFNAVSKQMDSVGVSAKSQAQTQKIEEAQIQQDAIQKSRTENKQNEEEIKQQLNQTVDKLNQDMEALNTNISFGFNDKISSLYVDVMEKDSGKLIRKIPTEEAMKLAERMQEIVGMIFDKKG